MSPKAFITMLEPSHTISPCHICKASGCSLTSHIQIHRASGSSALHVLNAALFIFPQLFPLSHKPASIAVVAVYSAAREVGVKAMVEWCAAINADREKPGILAVRCRQGRRKKAE